MVSRGSLLRWAWLWTAVALLIEPAWAAAPVDMAPMRYVAEPQGDHLDTAIWTLRRGRVQVDLVGAIHVGDRSYYQALQRKLDGYPRVLFELVKPEDVEVRELGPSEGGLSTAQRMVRDWLQLEFQLDRIDYRRKHFVHADLDSDQLFAQLRARAGDVLASLLAWSAADARRTRYADGTPRMGTAALLLALASNDRATALKRYLGRELTEVDLSGNGLGGLGFGAILIGERNAVAVRVLQGELDKGQKRLAIFYGAAHLPDLLQRLEALGFKRAGPPRWLVAWSIAPSAAHQAQRTQTAPAAK